jgi:hypothetical protein
MMASGAGKLALVPLLAVGVALGATGIHGRRTHDPTHAARAVEILAPTDDPAVARVELETFFETGWVGWDVKTAVEFACGTVRGRNIADPVSCVAAARSIAYTHECQDQNAYRTYTWLAWAALVPFAFAAVIASFVIAGVVAARRKRRPSE